MKIIRTVTSIEEVHEKISLIAEVHGWKSFNKYDHALSFIKEDPCHCVLTIYIPKRIDFDNPKFSVKSTLKHPKRDGNTTLNRDEITFKKLNRIFKNPRTHTGKGFYAKKK